VGCNSTVDGLHLSLRRSVEALSGARRTVPMPVRIDIAATTDCGGE